MPVIYCDTTEASALLIRAQNRLSARECHAAMASALNRTLTFVGAETKRQVQGEYAVSSSLQKGVKKIHATAASLHAEAIYTGATLPLYVFKNKAPNNQYRSPVSVLVKRSNGWQVHNGSNPAMFKGYGRKIMLRDGGQRDIRTAHTLSIPQMVSNDSVYRTIATKAEAKLYERVEHEITWRLSRV